MSAAGSREVHAAAVEPVAAPLKQGVPSYSLEKDEVNHFLDETEWPAEISEKFRTSGSGRTS